MSREKIYLVLFFGILCLSSSSILVKQLDYRGVPLLGIACYRMILTTLILAIPALIMQHRELVKLERARVWSMLLSGLFLALHFGSWTASLGYIPVARSVLLVTCHPIFTVLASRLFLGERFTKRNLIAVLTAFLGILVILSESAREMGGRSLAGDLLALIGAITIVGYFIIGKRQRAEVSLLSYSTIVYGICALLLVPMAWLSGAQPQLLNSNDLFLLFALAVLPTLGGHTIFNLLLKDVSATLISIAFLGEPLGASILAWLLWRQLPSPATIAGGALVLAGIFLVRPQVNQAEKKN